MNKLSLAATAAALAFVPMAAQAQNLAPAVVAVVDVDRIMATCTVCAAANTQLQAQVTQLQQRAQALGTPLQTEEAAIRAAVQGRTAEQIDAATRTRIQAFETSRQNAQNEVQQGQDRIQRNVAFVRQQIGQRVQPAIVTVMQQRGATVAIERGTTLAINPSVDVTDAVLAIVNQNGAALNVNAPPPQQQPAAGAPTPAAPTPAQPQQRRPQGR